MESYKNDNTLDIPGLHNYQLCLQVHKALCLGRTCKYLHNIVYFVCVFFLSFCKEPAFMGTCLF